MSEWWTYRPADFLMFAPATWWRLVEGMNRAWWPGPGLALLACVVLLVLAWRGRARSLQLLLLAAAWAVTGWAFHGERHAQVFLGAPALATACAVQAALLLAAAALAARRPMHPASAEQPARGGLLLLAAGAGFPLVGLAAGRPLAQAEVFGFMPDPTALATLGVLWAAPGLTRRTGVLLAVLPCVSLALGTATRWLLAT